VYLCGISGFSLFKIKGRREETISLPKIREYTIKGRREETRKGEKERKEKEGKRKGKKEKTKRKLEMYKSKFKLASLYQDMDQNNQPRGYLIRIGGRLKGISKAKRIIYKSGKINLQTTSAKIDYYSKPIFTK
jgi:hypothetical protein